MLMIEDLGCPYCAMWDREVRQAYLNSPEGRFAPLHRRFRSDPDLTAVPRVVYSPTFVLYKSGVEIGRILGYPGADLFWMQLAGLMEKAGYPAGTQNER